MYIKEITLPVKCDIGGCANKAVAAFGKQGMPPGSAVYLCQSCLDKLSALIGEREAKAAKKGKGKSAAEQKGGENEK